MKEFQVSAMNDNTEDFKNRFGMNIDGVIAMMNEQAIYDGQIIHDKEFQSYREYDELVKPLLALPDEMGVIGAISYITCFFYKKGLQDSARIRDRLFMVKEDK